MLETVNGLDLLLLVLGAIGWTLYLIERSPAPRHEDLNDDLPLLDYDLVDDLRKGTE